MYQYGWNIEYIISLTKEQIIMFYRIASKREEKKNKFLANINGTELETKTLDTDNAIPIENLIGRGGGNL